MKLRIVLEETFGDVARARLQGHDLDFFASRSDDRDHILKLTVDADVLGFRWPLSFDIDRDFLTRAASLKHIHKSGTGLEHPGVLDLKAAEELGILFSNNAGLNADVVAEHAILLLFLAMRAATVQQAVWAKEGRWDQSLPAGVPPARMLAGKSVGVVGLGQIGASVVKKLRGLSVGRIYGYQRRRPFEHSIYADLEWLELDALLQTADVIILCLPINASTEKLIDRRRIGLIRPDATVINIGRGGVLDEAAFYEALRDGRIRAAGLDVLTEEPSQSPIMTLPNVIVTPHMAGTAVEMQAMQIAGAVDAIADFAARKVPPRLTNPQVLESPRLRADWLRRGN